MVKPTETRISLAMHPNYHQRGTGKTLRSFALRQNFPLLSRMTLWPGSAWRVCRSSSYESRLARGFSVGNMFVCSHCCFLARLICYSARPQFQNHSTRFRGDDAIVIRCSPAAPAAAFLRVFFAPLRLCGRNLLGRAHFRAKPVPALACLPNSSLKAEL
jgi:hypothetical protein